MKRKWIDRLLFDPSVNIGKFYISSMLEQKALQIWAQLTGMWNRAEVRHLRRVNAFEHGSRADCSIRHSQINKMPYLISKNASHTWLVIGESAAGLQWLLIESASVAITKRIDKACNLTQL